MSAHSGGIMVDLLDFNPGPGACGIPNQETRIVGGQKTDINEYPWHLALVDIGENDPW